MPERKPNIPIIIMKKINKIALAAAASLSLLQVSEGVILITLTETTTDVWNISYSGTFDIRSLAVDNSSEISGGIHSGNGSINSLGLGNILGFSENYQSSTGGLQNFTLDVDGTFNIGSFAFEPLILVSIMMRRPHPLIIRLHSWV